MKKLAILAFLISPIGFAHAACIGEAQIIAKVSQVESDSLHYCKVRIDPSSVKHYSANMTCPLSLSDVLGSNVEVGLVNGHDCRLSTGQTLSGVIVQDAKGNLYLE